MTDTEYVAVKQFLALVGPDTDGLKAELISRLSCDESQRTITIRNNYYRANIGIQQFSELKQVVEAAAHEKNFPAILIQYTGESDVAQYEGHTNTLGSDVKLISVESGEEELADLEEWASLRSFEVVYIKPSQEQIETANELNEKYGVDRIVEALHLCNWPDRQLQIKDTGNPIVDRILQYVNGLEDEPGSEDRDISLTGKSAEVLWGDLCHMQQVAREKLAQLLRSRTPEPQHAERVHLSPDSPSGTDTTTHDDISVTVEFDLASPGDQKQEQAHVVEDSGKEVNSVNADVEEVVVSSAASKKKRKKNKSKKPQQESGTL